MAFLKTINLGQKYGERYVLKNVNLEIDKGDTFVLIGPTGAGKTTLIRLLDILETPVSGRIYIDGVDVTYSKHHRLEIRRRMALVQQKPVVFNMSVYDNVASGLRWRHEKSKIMWQKVEATLELVGMANYRNRNAKTLSGGETQRVAVARALVTEPEVLFLDEPTVNLDPISISKIEEVLAHIIREQKTTVVMATHNMYQGQRLAGRIGVLIDGEILQIGSPNEIFTSPKSREVAEFVGVENILAGVVIEKDNGLVTVEVNGSTIQTISDLGIGEKVFALVRPEDVTLTLSKETSSARNVFQGKIAKMTSVGPLLRIEVDCGFSLLGLVTKRSAEELELTIGNEIYASFKATAVRTLTRWG
ncbi:ABC transporter ATP-binding protein [Chloroflexota bacterium]